MTLSIRDCGGAQTAELLRFLGEAYGPNYILLRDPSFMRWQYRSPSGDGWRLKIAELDEKIIGTLGYIRTTFRLGKRSLRAVWACNWIVQDDYRKFGLGAMLLKDIMNDADVSLSSGIKPGSALNTMTGLGWMGCGYIPRLVAIIDPGQFAKLVQGGSAGIPAITVARDVSHDIRAVQRFSQDVDTLWSDVCDDMDAGNIRSADYLNHRYSDHPTFSYRLFEGRSSGRLRSIAVYRVEEARGVSGAPVRMGRIVELIGDLDQVSAMGESLLCDAVSQGCMGMDFFCTHQRTCDQLHRIGFVTLDRPTAERIANLLNPVTWDKTGINLAAYPASLFQNTTISSWYITKGDNDQDRPN